MAAIQVRQETREKLAGLKARPRETFDEVVNRLLALVPEGDDEGLYTNAFRAGLLRARLDVKEGRLTDHSKVAPPRKP